MRLGLVRYLNARPLDFAFQASKEHARGITCYLDTPARLVSRLLDGELDAALISSVECFRNADRLAWCESVGVAGQFEVRSLLYIRRRFDDLDRPVLRLYLDEGSRTTAALVRLLYLLRFGQLPECISLPPEEIPEQLNSTSAGLLIGDAALSMYQSPGEFHFRDLVTWWRSETGLPFVAALWAFPVEQAETFRDAFFESALAWGLEHLNDILRMYGEEYRSYLTEALHYYLTDEDRRSLRVFSGLLQEKGLL
jgi:chorismate dehydratase